MFTRVKRLFAARETPRQPYNHPALGTFAFEKNLGWRRVCCIGGRDVEVVIGSDGEYPSQEMADTAQDWVLNWESLRSSVLEHIERELSTWEANWYPTDADRLLLSSINVLWTKFPTTAMLHFDDSKDDIRCWHATYRARELQGFAFDD